VRPRAALGALARGFCSGDAGDRLAKSKAARLAALVTAGAALLVVTVGGESATAAAPQLSLGAKSSAEGLLLGELYKQMLQANGFDVAYSTYRTTKAMDQALRRGRIDMYVEDTALLLQSVFRRKPTAGARGKNYGLAKKLQEPHGATLLSPTRSAGDETDSGSGALTPVIRTVLLKTLATRFTSPVNALSARLTERTLDPLGAAVAARKRTAAAAAKSFLKAAGLIQTANVFVAANGNDNGSNCRRFDGVRNPDSAGGSVCKSLDKAYHVARAGDTVEVAAGSYPPQTIAAKAGAAAPNVLIRPAAGATVSLADLVTAGSFLTLRDMTIPTGSNHGRGWQNTGSNVTLDNVDVTGPWANVLLTGGSNVTWQNSSLGTPGNTAIRLCQMGDHEPMELSNVSNLLLSNIDFYQFHAETGNPACGPDSNMHLETIRVWDDVNGWRLERSRFHRGDGSNSARVFFSKISGGDPTNITFVNNWFGDSSGSVSIYLTANSACTNYTFAYNAWEEGFIDDCSPKTSLKMVGNTGTQPNYLPCMGTANIRDLWVWNSAGNCGSDQWLVDSGNSLTAYKYAADGYHLQANSPGINQGETTECMALTGGVDIDNRPRSGPCDTGPDEYGN
jgi:hypothetical protein